MIGTMGNNNSMGNVLDFQALLLDMMGAALVSREGLTA
jgi:hypothetical protein